ncbi:MAG: DegV family protein [Acidimicrobiales bacterium]
MSVSIVTDSGCDLPWDLVGKHGITVVPLTVRFGAEELVAGPNLSPAEFWQRCAGADQLPETAAPSPGAFDEAFRAAAAAGADAVVCVNLSSRLSATIQAAQTAAVGVADVIPVRVVDSLSATMGQGMVVLAAVRAAAAGAGGAEVAGAAESAATAMKVFGALDTLDFLKKGGRIGGAQAFLGSLLSVKPTIEVVDGKVEPGPKVRTRSKALQFLADKVKENAASIQHLAVLNGAAPDCDAFLDLLGQHFPRERIVVGDIGPVIGAHTGPGTIGVAYLAG